MRNTLSELTSPPGPPRTACLLWTRHQARNWNYKVSAMPTIWEKLLFGVFWIAFAPTSKDMQNALSFTSFLVWWKKKTWHMILLFLTCNWNSFELSKLPGTGRGSLPKSGWLNIWNPAHQQNPDWALKSLWFRPSESPVTVRKLLTTKDNRLEYEKEREAALHRFSSRIFIADIVDVFQEVTCINLLNIFKNKWY